jgi:hypothetical protein
MKTVEFTIPDSSDVNNEQEEFMNRAKFSKLVENAAMKKRMSYMDAIIYVCEDIEMEVEDVKKYLSTHILSQVKEEALDLNCLKKEEFRLEYTRNTLY